MKPGKVRGVLYAALLATLTAVYFAPPAANDSVELSEHARMRSDSGTTAAVSSVVMQDQALTNTVEVMRIRPREGGEDDRVEGVLMSAGWEVPPVKVPVVASAAPPSPPPAPPQAPPLPFRAVGRYVEEGRMAVFLQFNDQNLIARVGDTVAGLYKLESLNESMASFRYLPLDQLQTLRLGNGG